MLISIVLTALAAFAAGAALVYRPRTAPAPPAGGLLVVRRAAFPLPTPEPGDADYDPLYALPARKTIGEASSRRRPYTPSSVVVLGRRDVDGRQSLSSSRRLVAAAASARCPLVVEKPGIAFEHLNDVDLVVRLGAGHADTFATDGRFSLARLIELADAHRQVKAVEITLGGAVAGHLPMHDADSLLDFCESIAGATGLPIGIHAEGDDIPFWMELARLIDTTQRTVDFVTILGGEDILSFAIGFSRVQKLFAMRSLHGRIVFSGARSRWTAEEALFAFALGCDLLELQALSSSRTAAIARDVVDLRHRMLRASRQSGALHPADILASQIELIDPPCWSRTAAEMFGGRGVGSACGDERRFIDVVERSGNALPFRRRH